MTNIIKLKTGAKFEELLSYSRLVVVDNWVYVSLTAGRNPETKEIPEDITEQTEQVIKNIEFALAAVDAKLEDVIMSRVFIQNPADTRPVMECVAARFKGIDPAITITSPALGSPVYKVELEVTAYRGASSADVQRITVSQE